MSKSGRWSWVGCPKPQLLWEQVSIFFILTHVQITFLSFYQKLVGGMARGESEPFVSRGRFTEKGSGGSVDWSLRWSRCMGATVERREGCGNQKSDE